MSDMRLSVILEAVDRISRPMARASQAVQKFNRSSGMDRVGRAASNAGKKIGGATDQLGRFLGKAALAGGAGGYLFKTQFLDVAAAFERYQTVLETTEGTSEKARRAMEWVNDFAVGTPYQLDELVASFVKLRSYGLDPTNGMLTTLGNTAAAMGKPLNQAVEAMADAITGENERLKEFGITARTVGNKVVYEYTSNGQTMRKVAQKGNRAMIQETLTAIWNEKYAGAMDKLSNTWVGMMADLGDQWTRFANKVMANGVFKWMKARLKGVLDEINELADSGKLDELARDFGGNIVAAFKEFWKGLQAVLEVARAFGEILGDLKELLGGWKPVLIAIGAIIAGPFLVAVGSATVAIGGFLAALMATPVGWIIAGILAIVAAVGLIYENWGAVADWLESIWNRIKIGGQALKIFFLDIVAEIGNMIGGLIDMVPETMRSTVGLDGLSSSINELDAWRKKAGLDLQNLKRENLALGSAQGEFAGLAVQKTQVGGTLKISIDSEGRPKVRELKSNNPDVGIDVDTGYAMAGG